MPLLPALASIATAAAPKAAAPVRLPRQRTRRSAPTLPLELAFWALWHCRHARPPDVSLR
ncbi:hypothetical protein [Pseudomonas jinjuensis]|uniref:hypothetical protein n=1 Tax=Pseudomonas jinjuensis TaxID=198616 RepID=UPI000A0323C1|nr:hypothetical protein [Pseudomonas jinjuensis]